MQDDWLSHASCKSKPSISESPATIISGVISISSPEGSASGRVDLSAMSYILTENSNHLTQKPESGEG